MSGYLKTNPREAAVVLVLGTLLVLLGLLAPGFFQPGNLRDILLVNVPVLVISIGVTLVIIARQIDVSVGAIFACCTVVTGLLARAGLPLLVYVGLT
ncbi:MAG: ABC transporter permease, partial [Acidobacteria bacterium]|nr:ABC transporter permease [Acidobacteriota bacterium]